MQASIRKKLWGLLAFSPWILFFTVVPFVLPITAKMHAVAQTTDLNSIDIAYLVVGNLYVLIVILCFLIYLNRLKTIEKEKKWLWRALLFFGHAFTIPIFWYFYIWKENK